MFCKRCGNNIPSDSKFCSYCGLENPMLNWSQNNDIVNNPQPTQKREQPKETQTENQYSYNSNSVDNTPKKDSAPKQSFPKLNQTEISKKGKWKYLIIIVVIVAIIAYFAGHSGSGKLKGTWEATSGDVAAITFTDSENGYIMYDEYDILNFTYYTDGDEIEMKTEYTLFHDSAVVRIKYKIQGNTLTLTETENYDSGTFYKK